MLIVALTASSKSLPSSVQGGPLTQARMPSVYGRTVAPWLNVLPAPERKAR